MDSINPMDINFTQCTASQYFSDGSNINEMIGVLCTGDTDISSIRKIRIVQYDQRMWSLDNRRLVVFCSANLPSIDIELLTLSDPAVNSEFRKKFKPIDDEGRMIVIADRKSAKESFAQLKRYGRIR